MYVLLDLDIFAVNGILLGTFCMVFGHLAKEIKVD